MFKKAIGIMHVIKEMTYSLLKSSDFLVQILLRMNYHNQYV